MHTKLILTAALCLLLCTGCVNIPEPDPIPAPPAETELAPPPAPAAEEAEELAPPPAPAAAEEETGEAPPAPEDAEPPEEETEEETEPPAPWKLAYQALLTAKAKASAPEDSYFALIRLNADDVPELVVLEETRMELYCFDGDHTVMLLEDAYKTAATEDQNVCYKPEESMFSTAFSTMGGGMGFTIFVYTRLDPLGAERLCFNDIENVDGELPYNPIWDRAVQYDVRYNGIRDVTLGDSWVHIGEDFEGLERLTLSHAEHAGEDWGIAEEETGED